MKGMAGSFDVGSWVRGKDGVGVTVPDERPYGDRLRYTKIDIFKLAWEAKVS